MLCLNAYTWQWYNKSLPSAGATDMEIQILLVTVQSYLSNLLKTNKQTKNKNKQGKKTLVSFSDLKKIFFEDFLYCFLDPIHSLAFYCSLLVTTAYGPPSNAPHNHRSSRKADSSERALSSHPWETMT